MMTVIAGASGSRDVDDLHAPDVTARPRIHAAVCCRMMLGEIGNNLEGAGAQERSGNKRATNHGAENHSRRGAGNNSNQSKRPSFRGRPASSLGQCFSKYESYVRLCREYHEQNSEGDTRLHMAVVQQLPMVVSSLVRAVPHPGFLDIKNDDAQTPLHVAVLTRQADIVLWLVEAGADPASRDRRGNTALHLACQVGEMSCVKALTNKDLISRGRDKPSQMEGAKSVTTSRESQDVKVVSKHSPRGVINVPVKELTNRSEVGENTKVFTDSCQEGVITIGPQNRDIKVPRDLSKEGISSCQKRDVMRRGSEVLGSSLDRTAAGEISPRELFAVLNFEGETCAHVAANHGHVDALRWLVRCGADPDARDAKSGNTVLHAAVERGIDSVSRYLLEECAVDLETRNYAGLTAYDVACDVSPQLAVAMARRGGGRHCHDKRKGKGGKVSPFRVVDSKQINHTEPL